MPTLNINRKDTAVDADESTPIPWALRYTLGMTGTKFGCGQALCSDRQRQGRKAVHAAWVKHDVEQCGYCQSGQITSATALLKGKKKPSDADIDAAMRATWAAAAPMCAFARPSMTLPVPCPPWLD